MSEEVVTLTEQELQARFTTIVEHTLPYTVSVLILKQSDLTPDGIIANGTGSLVEIGESRFLITAKHVADEFSKPDLVGVIGGHGAPPVDVSNWRIIDSDSRIDVATIEVPHAFDPGTIQKQFHKPDGWPPQRAQRDEVAVFLGVPGIHRRTKTDGVINHVTPFCDFVSSASTRHFIMACEGQRHVVKFDDKLPDFGSTGGVSGAPVFIYRKKKLVFCGIIYEGDETEKATFFAAHADFVKADGMLDKGIIL